MSKRGKVANRAASQRHRPAVQAESEPAPVVAVSTRPVRVEKERAAAAARETRGSNRWDAIDALAGTVKAERSIVRRRDRQVRAARAAGATWTELGRVLGVSPQAVQQRYGGKSSTS